jgi:hypothetical protein
MKDKLVRNFVIGTFVTLYLLVSVISTIHVIDFFELSNPYWLAVKLAVGFEVGAAASLASLVILKKMNKTLVWALFITITLMQMQGNMYYAFKNISNYETWSQLFNLIEEDPIYQKRILAFVSGAILPLIALGFIKSLVDYIKPEENEENEVISTGTFDDDMIPEEYETKPSQEFFEDIQKKDDYLVDQEELELWDQTLLDGLEELEEEKDFFEELEDEIIQDENPVNYEPVKPWWDGQIGTNGPDDSTLDEVETPKNDMLNILELEIDDENINPTSVGAMVKKIPTTHLPNNEDQLWKDAMDKRAEEDMNSFIKKNNESK